MGLAQTRLLGCTAVASCFSFLHFHVVHKIILFSQKDVKVYQRLRLDSLKHVFLGAPGLRPVIAFYIFMWFTK